jgi:hypothetical protein
MLDSKCAEAARVARDAAYERAAQCALANAMLVDDPRLAEFGRRIAVRIADLKLKGGA